MSSLVIRSLSVLLGLFFLYVGVMKISPMLSKDMYQDNRREFVKYTKVFPLGGFIELKAKWYRRVFGSLEAVFGFAMAAIPVAAVKDVSNVVLLLLTILMGYNHYAVSNQFEKFAPFLVFFFLLCCRLIVSWQIRRKERQDKLKQAVEKELEEEKKSK